MKKRSSLFIITFPFLLFSCGPQPKPDPVTPGYKERTDKNIHFGIKAGDDTAYYYYYFAYQDNGMQILVDVVDNEIVTSYPDTGYNDNIEFNCSIQTLEVGYDVNNSYNVMLNTGLVDGWIRRPKSKSELDYDSNYLTYYINNGYFSCIRTPRLEEVDLYNGMTLDIFMSYDFWGVTKEQMKGKFTIEAAGRNSSYSGHTEFRSSVTNGTKFAYANLATLIKEDGRPVSNDIDLPNFSNLIKQKGIYKEGFELDSNFAGIDSSYPFQEYRGGVQLFDNRDYFLYYNNLPNEFIGKSYSFGPIDGNEVITVREAGYLVIVAPATGYQSLLTKLSGYNFVLLNDSPLPTLGYSSTGMSGTQEAIYYYAKWAEQGETYSFGKYHITLSKRQANYAKREWEINIASVLKMSDDALFEKYAPHTRQWQGIPGIDGIILPNGRKRLFASFFTGGNKEPNLLNYATYYYSDDDGQSWEFAFVVDFPEGVAEESRVYDPSLMVFNGKLYLYWNQTGSGFYSSQTCCAIISNPGVEINSRKDIENFIVERTFICGQGLKLNKPRPLSTGELIYLSHDITKPKTVDVYSSLDEGLTWSIKGSCKVWNYNFVTESSFYQIDDEGKELVMYSRCDYSYYIGISYSHDGGVTWTETVDSGLIAPSSRSNAMTLSSGNVVYLQNYNSYNRENVFIQLSDNRGKSFDHKLILDARSGVAYPDVTQLSDGSIYVTWDYDRYGSKTLYFTKLSEEELLAINGVSVLDSSRIGRICTVNATNQSYSIEGQVLDKDDNPISNATVLFNGSEAYTDNEGYYRFNNVHVDGTNKPLLVKKDGYVDVVKLITVNDVIDANFHIKKSVKMEESKVITIKGKAVGLDENPIANVDVTINQNTIQTDVNGEFEFTNIQQNLFDIKYELENYRTVNQSSDEGSLVGDVLTLNTVVMSKNNETDLGFVGGKNAHKVKIWSERTNDGIKFFGKLSETTADKTGFEVFINAYGYCVSRSKNTFYFRFLKDNTFLAKNYPNNSQANLTTSEGVSCVFEDNIIKGYVPYSVISQYLPESLKITKDNSVGIAITAVNASKSGTNYDVWYGSNIPDFPIEGEIVRGRSKEYAILRGNCTLGYKEQDNIYTSSVLYDLVKNSSIYHSGKDFNQSNMASASGVTTKRVAKGQNMFSDRDIHYFDDFRIEALDGYSFVFDSVLAASTVTITTPGYVILGMISTLEQTNEGFEKLISDYSNPGLASSPAHALYNYYFAYVNAGDQIVVSPDSLLFLK